MVQSRASSVADGDSVHDSVGGEEDGDAPGAVFLRLHAESSNLKQKLKEKRKQIMIEMGETFSPRISEKSRQIATLQRSQTRAGEKFLQVNVSISSTALHARAGVG